ncbi:protein EPIDERMAL PATTERNING FACTOR 2 [Punica granatum]|uniref:Epidermal patterning factor-like protein n=2 Tax=Punica granatum TaxID=22663 RepID=A0A218W6G9_PUNGR|nr:protein EPIDERMAL PATTERNING FACTOR 2 [Punica granatum]OWM67682.1 hypothetical protein CDL15_Pgr019183 [Punica granatum]PKI73472.1 hypothetical protein CRG98_006053 [Punica granatum]
MKNLPVGAHKSFIILLLFLALLGVTSEVRSNTRGHVPAKERAASMNKETEKEQLYPTGSSLPDCTHACGPCVPCKRVMISYKCATESCPIVYRCMCKGKYYHVPSSKF